MLDRIINKFGIASFLFASIIIVNLGNYGLYLLLGRYLGPEEFAAANIIATIVLVLSFIALSFQLTTAKYCTEIHSEKKENEIATFLSWIKKFSFFCSVIISTVLLISIDIIQEFLHFSTALPLVIIFISIPVYFRLCVLRGYYQGVSSFKVLAFTYLTEMLTRLASTFILIYVGSIYFPNFVIETVSIGFLISFLIAILFYNVKSRSHKEVQSKQKYREVALFLLIVACYELSRILIDNCDVVLVKHFFDNTESGLFAAMDLIGKVVFFATFTVVTLLFPKVIELKKSGKSHAHLFWSSLTIVASFGLLLTSMTYFFDQAIIYVLFGKSYLVVSPLLWKYCLASTIFSCANVFVYYHMSLDNYLPVWISLFVGVLQIVCIYFYHDSIQIIINIQLILMTALLAALMSYHNLISETRYKLVIKVNEKLGTQYS